MQEEAKRQQEVAERIEGAMGGDPNPTSWTPPSALCPVEPGAAPTAAPTWLSQAYYWGHMTRLQNNTGRGTTYEGSGGGEG